MAVCDQCPVDAIGSCGYCGGLFCRSHGRTPEGGWGWLHVTCYWLQMRAMNEQAGLERQERQRAFEDAWNGTRSRVLVSGLPSIRQVQRDKRFVDSARFHAIKQSARDKDPVGVVLILRFRMDVYGHTEWYGIDAGGAPWRVEEYRCRPRRARDRWMIGVHMEGLPELYNGELWESDFRNLWARFPHYFPGAV